MLGEAPTPGFFQHVGFRLGRIDLWPFSHDKGLKKRHLNHRGLYPTYEFGGSFGMWRLIVGVNQPCWKNQAVNSFISIESAGRWVDKVVDFSYEKRKFLLLLSVYDPGASYRHPRERSSRRPPGSSAALVLTVEVVWIHGLRSWIPASAGMTIGSAGRWVVVLA